MPFYDVVSPDPSIEEMKEVSESLISKGQNITFNISFNNLRRIGWIMIYLKQLLFKYKGRYVVFDKNTRIALSYIYYFAIFYAILCIWFIYYRAR